MSGSYGKYPYYVTIQKLTRAELLGAAGWCFHQMGTEKGKWDWLGTNTQDHLETGLWRSKFYFTEQQDALEFVLRHS